jgi:hypothetical protein
MISFTEQQQDELQQEYRHHWKEEENYREIITGIDIIWFITILNASSATVERRFACPSDPDSYAGGSINSR